MQDLGHWLLVTFVSLSCECRTLGPRGGWWLQLWLSSPGGAPHSPHCILRAFPGHVSALMPAQKYMNCGDDGSRVTTGEIEAESQGVCWRPLVSSGRRLVGSEGRFQESPKHVTCGHSSLLPSPVWPVGSSFSVRVISGNHSCLVTCSSTT